jgi:(p)ppGpp synthase/HD superfamily hydrolase
MAELEDDILDIKFADRIHNLRTLDLPGVEKEKLIRKIHETEKYFMKLAQSRNTVAYELMLIEIDKIKTKYSITDSEI